ncbi:hypothetical protein AYO49_04930 [Verrucomicrobiaceae bacterium SCGC AG-212-N21]|nr:hypothetical protein AYO49_04930 [Verrucomicrobiaceae bacterium SCGC AG-212-N21]
MRAASRHSSHLTAWTLSILAVPVLYLLSVPVLIKLVCQPTPVIDDSGQRWWNFSNRIPQWLETYIAPVTRNASVHSKLLKPYGYYYCDWVYGLGN